MENETRTCVNCPDYYLRDGSYYCRKIETERIEICWACSRSSHNPKTSCLVDKFDAYAKAHPNSVPVQIEEKEEPLVKLKCCDCGTITELPQSEYLDKRKRRKYEPRSHCEKCNWFTRHVWELLP